MRADFACELPHELNVETGGNAPKKQQISTELVGQLLSRCVRC